MELDNGVKEIQTQLEMHLTQSNNILSSCDKMLKLTENYEMLNDNNDIKTLYYISEINKNNEKVKSFFNMPIKNIDIIFGSFLNNLYINEYYFSGIPVPKDIKVEENDNKIAISWTIADIRKNDLFFDNKYKYLINAKINGHDDKLVYTSFKNYLLLEKYDENKDYEIKVRICLDDALGEWSEIKNLILMKLKIVKEVF